MVPDAGEGRHKTGGRKSSHQRAEEGGKKGPSGGKTQTAEREKSSGRDTTQVIVFI